MSHNLTDIEGHQQDRDGTITPLASTDLSDVSGSPASSEAITYNGGWSPATAPTAGTQTTEVVGWVGGYLNTYSLGSTKQPNAGGLYRISWGGATYRPLYYQNTAHVTFKTNNGYNAWSTNAAHYVDRAELAAGTYRFNFRHVAYSGSASPFIDVRWETYGGDPLGPVRRVSDSGVPCNVSGAGKFTVSTTIVLKVITHTGNCFVPFSGTSTPKFNQNLQLSIVRIA